MNIFSLYLVSILDNVRDMLLIVLIVSIFIMIACIVSASNEKSENEDEDKDKVWRCAKIGFLLFILSGFLLVIIPDTKSAVAVIAGRTVLEFANSDHAKSITSKSYQVLDKFFDDQIKNDKRD